MIVRNRAAALEAALKLLFRELAQQPTPAKILALVDRLESGACSDPGRTASSKRARTAG